MIPNQRDHWRELALEHYFARLMSARRNPVEYDLIIRSMERNLEQAKTNQPPLLMYEDRYPCSIELNISLDAPEWALIFNYLKPEQEEEHILVTGGYDQLAGYMDEIYGRLLLHGYEKTHDYVLNLFTIKRIPDRGRVHVVKTQNPHYTKSNENLKPFELRYDDDRNYQEGDTILQREYHPETGYSGRMLQYLITSVLRDYPGLEQGYVILGLHPRQHVDAALADYEFRDAAEKVANEFFAEHHENDKELTFSVLETELLLGLWGCVSRDVTIISAPESIGSLRFTIVVSNLVGSRILPRVVDIPLARGDTEWERVHSFICECLSNFCSEIRREFPPSFE